MKLEALLTTAHTLAPAVTVFLDLSSGRDMLREGESLALPVYRALLRRLGYSVNELLAELEFTLEGEGRLAAFEVAVMEATLGRAWAQVRDVALAKNYASRALHIIDPANFPNADSWAKAATAPSIDHNWLADRAVELLTRRAAARGASYSSSTKSASTCAAASAHVRPPRACRGVPEEARSTVARTSRHRKS